MVTLGLWGGDVRLRDYRLLVPGWAGELSPDEYDYLQGELSTDNKLAYNWGFAPSKKRRPDWAVRQVALAGNPNSRTENLALVRRQE